jgi:hypothetical protein
MRSLLTATVVLTLSACPKVDNPFVCTGTDCDGGTGGSGGGGASQGGGAAGGMAAGGGTATGGGGTTCMSNWLCGQWLQGTPPDGGLSRQCFDGNQCAMPTNPPILTAAMPPLDFAFFQCKVQPVLAKSCSMSMCHGGWYAKPPLVFSRGRYRNDEMVTVDVTPFGCETGMKTFNLANDSAWTGSCRGLVPLTPTEWQLAYDTARSLALDPGPGQSPYLTNPDSSPMLNDVLRGTPQHQDAKPFATKSDPDYGVIRAWLDGGTAPPNCNAGTNN